MAVRRSWVNEDKHALTKHLFQIRNEIDNYFNAIIGKRTKLPQQDLISGLIKVKPMAMFYPEKKSFPFVALLFIAGHITTDNLIGNTILSLLQNPEQLKILQSNTLSPISPTIEETITLSRS